MQVLKVYAIDVSYWTSLCIIFIEIVSFRQNYPPAHLGELHWAMSLFGVWGGDAPQLHRPYKIKLISILVQVHTFSLLIKLGNADRQPHSFIMIPLGANARITWELSKSLYKLPLKSCISPTFVSINSFVKNLLFRCPLIGGVLLAGSENLKESRDKRSLGLRVFLFSETIRVGELNQSLSEVKAIPSALLESILQLFVTSRIYPLLDHSSLIISHLFLYNLFPPLK